MRARLSYSAHSRWHGFVPPPSLRWDHWRITFATAMALLPVSTVYLVEAPIYHVAGLLLALAVCFAWHALFAFSRKQAMQWQWIITALTFYLLAADGLSLWQQSIALSLGVVFADLIFGGLGRTFLNPTVVALAFAIYSFPNTLTAPQGVFFALAAVAGGVLLLYCRIASWRVLTGFSAGCLLGLVAIGRTDFILVQPLGVVVFAAVFLVADPVAAASTPTGRWAYGLFVGIITALLLSAGGEKQVQAIVFATLLGSVFAPLIDQVVCRLLARRRRWRG